MSTLVAPRSRAAARVNRISVDLDRSSGYLLGNISNAVPTSTSIRRARDSSLTSVGRISSTDTTTSSIRIRESSLTRGGSLGVSSAIRNSVMIPPSLETAKYNREQEMKEIHSNFMKNYDTTKKKLNSDIEVPEDSERKSKAYQRIINNDPPSYLSEREAKNACISDMFMDTSKFSTKTLSAIEGLEGAVLRKKDKEYNWRKEMEDYEKRAKFEQDVRARCVTALHKNDNEEDHWSAARKTEDRKRASRDAIEKPIEKAAKKEAEKPKEPAVTKSWREKREAERAAEKVEPEVERKSWREKLAEKQKQEEEEKKQKEAEAEAIAATVAQAKQRAEAAAAADVSADAAADSTAKPAEHKAEGDKAEGEEEEEDTHGTKQLKSDVSFLFSNLEEEMAAGQSKLAKLKERIKKAKTAIKEADDENETEESKESEAEKDKRRAELREKFRLQREAKKKAKLEQQ